VRERATGTTYDIAVIGNYTKDTIVSGEGTRMVDGGGFNYGAVAAAKTGLRVAAVTRLAKEDFYVVDALEAAGVDVFPTATPRSTHMRLEYRTSNVDERVLSVTQHAGAYTADQFRDLSARVFLINASTRGEVPLDVIAYLRNKAPLLAADVQAFVRVIATDGTLVCESWPERDEVLSMMDVLKADSKEAELLTGERSSSPTGRAFSCMKGGDSTVNDSTRSGWSDAAEEGTRVLGRTWPGVCPPHPLKRQGGRRP
jgi:sugar/nucleoside kinase (ribokinase family)